jgi:hypothetical protein
MSIQTCESIESHCVFRSIMDFRDWLCVPMEKSLNYGDFMWFPNPWLPLYIVINILLLVSIDKDSYIRFAV